MFERTAIRWWIVLLVGVGLATTGALGLGSATNEEEITLGDANGWYWNRLAVEALRAGDIERALEVLPEVIADPNSRQYGYYNLSCAHAISGELHLAIDAFEACLAHGYRDAEHIADDEDLDSLREHERFRLAMERYGLMIDENLLSDPV